MNLSDFNDELVEAKLAWKRQGKKIVRRVRCTAGKRKGRVVATAAACGKAINVKKRFLMRKIRRRFKAKIALKTRRTKRFNPVSKRLQKLNKPR